MKKSFLFQSAIEELNLEDVTIIGLTKSEFIKAFGESEDEAQYDVQSNTLFFVRKDSYTVGDYLIILIHLRLIWQLHVDPHKYNTFKRILKPYVCEIHPTEEAIEDAHEFADRFLHEYLEFERSIQGKAIIKHISLD